MSKNKKQNWLKIHPLHFHLGMYIAVATILVTTMKNSESIMAVLYPHQWQTGDLMSDTFLRSTKEAEAYRDLSQYSFTRYPGISGL